jgi:hypothetical protein
MLNAIFHKSHNFLDKQELLCYIYMIVASFKYLIQFSSPDADAKKGPGIGVPGGGAGGQAAQDPIGALQNLARQGTLRNSIWY